MPEEFPESDARRRLAHQVLEGLLEAIRPGPGLPPRWDAAEPYMLRHAIQHAADAGRVDDLLSDLEFLVHADPAGVLAALGDADAPRARLLASIYRSSARHHRTTGPDARRQILGLDAARFGDADAAGSLAMPEHVPMSMARPVWSSSAQVESALLSTFHRDARFTALAVTVTAAGRTVAVIGDYEGRIGIVDIDRAEAIGLPVPAHLDVVRDAGAGTLGGRPVVATVADAARLWLWDVTAGEPIPLGDPGQGSWLRASSHPVLAVELVSTADEDLVVTAGGDGIVRAWQLPSGQLRQELHGHTKAVHALTSGTVDGRAVVVSAAHDGTALVWDLAQGVNPTELRAGNDAWLDCAALTESAAGPRLVAGGTRGVSIWDLRTGELEATQGRSEPLVAAVATTEVEGRRLLVYAGQDGGVRLRDLDAPGSAPILLAGHTEPVTGLATSSLNDAPVAITAGTDGTVRVWDCEIGLRDDRHDRGAVHTLDVNDIDVAVLDGAEVLVSGGDDGQIIVWDAAGGHRRLPVISIPTEGWTGPEILSVHAMRGADPRIVAGTTDGRLLQWDLRSGVPLSALEADFGPVNAIASLDVDGMPVIVGGGDDSVLRLWDPGTGLLLRELEGHTDWINAVDVAVIDGTPVALTGGNDGTVRLWDLSEGTQLGPALRRDETTVDAVILMTIDGSPVAAAGGEDAHIRFWDLSRGQDVATLEQHSQPITSLSLVAAGGAPLLISGGRDAVLRFWDPAARAMLGVYRLPETVRALGNTASGRVAVAYGWEVATFAIEAPAAPRPVTAPGGRSPGAGGPAR